MGGDGDRRRSRKKLRGTEDREQDGQMEEQEVKRCRGEREGKGRQKGGEVREVEERKVDKMEKRNFKKRKK